MYDVRKISGTFATPFVTVLVMQLYQYYSLFFGYRLQLPLRTS